MEINIEELKEWNRNSKRGINREIDSMKERLVQFYDYAKATDVIDALISKNDDLEEEVEQKREEVDDLQRQLLEAQNLQLESEKQQLESEKQQLEAEAQKKATEIHNHFESGCSAQVFNDKVTGKFTKKNRWKKKEKEKKRLW